MTKDQIILKLFNENQELRDRLRALLFEMQILRDVFDLDTAMTFAEKVNQCVELERMWAKKSVDKDKK